jgi:ankyrin repeat protein
MAATYERALKKVGRSRSNATLAQRIFKWIVCAKRPLLITELAEAIAFAPSDRSWDPTKIPDHSRLIQACGNLVVFDDDRTVRLAHHSVQQFLLESPTKDSLPEFHFQRLKASVEAGEICVTYLSFSDFETQITISRPNNLREAPGPAAILDSIASPLGIRYVTSSIFKLGRYMRTGRVEQQPLTFDLAKLAKLKKPPPPSLGEKYHFLNYAIENWLSHTSAFSEDNTMWKSFRYLAMDKPTAFDIRAWGDSDSSNGLPYMGLFHWAIDTGHVPLLKLLLQLPRGSDLHAYCRQESEEGRSIVLNVSHRGHANVIEFLANQDCIDTRDGRPLIKAAESGYDFAARILQECGLCVEAKTEALQIAAACGHAAVMHVLLENEPLLDLQNGWGKFALDEAVKRGSDGVLVALLSKAASFDAAVIDLEKVWGGTALHEAAKRGFDRLVKLLLQEKGVHPDSKDGGGRTLLSWAAGNGHEAVVKLLVLEKDVDPDSKDDGDRTPLSRAAGNGHEDVVRLLLVEKGVDPDSKNGNERTPLSWAAGNGHETVVRLLLVEKGVNPNSKDDYGWTPLSWAAEKGYEAVVRLLLLEKAVDPNSKDNDGRTPLSWAVERGNKAVVRLLLLEKGVDPNSKDNGGQTPLSWAAEKGHEAVVRLLLLEKAVDPNSEDNGGQTPLSRAAEKRHEAVVRLLKSKTRR